MGNTHVNQHILMTTSLATLALTLLLTGTALAQQPRRSAGNKTATGSARTSSSSDATRSNSSTGVPQEGAAGVAVGTGLTNDQQQGAGSSSDRTTKVDAQSSIRTGPSSVKARKKTPKSGS